MTKLLTPEEEVELYKRENARLTAERNSLLNDWRNACELMNRAEAERDALRALLREARDRASAFGMADLPQDIDAALAGEKQ